jgi:hypothetical protein
VNVPAPIAPVDSIRDNQARSLIRQALGRPPAHAQMTGRCAREIAVRTRPIVGIALAIVGIALANQAVAQIGRPNGYDRQRQQQLQRQLDQQRRENWQRDQERLRDDGWRQQQEWQQRRQMQQQNEMQRRQQWQPRN